MFYLIELEVTCLIEITDQTKFNLLIVRSKGTNFRQQGKQPFPDLSLF